MRFKSDRHVFSRRLVWLLAAVAVCGAATFAQDNEQTRQIIPVFEKARQKNLGGKKSFLPRRNPQPRLRVARRASSGLQSSVAQMRPPKSSTIQKSAATGRKNAADFALDQAQKVGLTLWKMEAPKKGETPPTGAANARSVVHPVDGYVPTRVSSETFFRPGDKIRLSVESPTDGYLYVFNCEVYADERIGRPTLIFPTARIRSAANFLTAGRPIEFPAITDQPSYFELRPNPNQPRVVAEALVFIVTKTPLDNVQTSNESAFVDENQLKIWQQKWAGVTEVWELENATGKVYTQGEYESALPARSRALGADDPEPQTLFAVESPTKDGLLVTLLLRYL